MNTLVLFRLSAMAMVLLLAVIPVRSHAEVAGDQQTPASALRIHGSNTVGEHLAPALIEAWLSSRGIAIGTPDSDADNDNERRWTAGGLHIELHAHGSNTGLRDLLAGHADIAMASRSVMPAEINAAQRAGLGRLDAPAQEFVVALDGLAIIVHPANPVVSMDIDTLRRVFAGEIRNWRILGGADRPIRLLARDDQSGTYETFRALVLADARLSASTRRFESTDALARQAVSDPDAIGFVGLAGIGQARALAIHDAGTAPLPPETSSVAVEDYVLTRRLYLYLRADAGTLARSFASFAVSDAAQSVVERTGFVGQAIRTIRWPVAETAPDDYLGIVANSLRLSLNFRFGTGSAVLDTRAVRDLERLALFLRQPAYAHSRLILLGFADASETLPYMAISLTNDRVDYIAEQLAALGVPVATARGVGGVMPIASNRTDWGRHRNRRVEVWIKNAGS